jgi:hypothetical protein
MLTTWAHAVEANRSGKQILGTPANVIAMPRFYALTAIAKDIVDARSLP